MKTAQPSRLPRILTRQERLAHQQANFNSPTWPKESKELAADLATVNSNYMHNPVTGHHEFAKGTPAWVVNIAKRRGCIAIKGKIEWS